MRVAAPERCEITGAVYLHQRHRPCRRQLSVEPFEHKTCHRRHGTKDIRAQICQQITHLAAVGQSRNKRIPTAQSIAVLQRRRQIAQKPHIVDAHVGLKWVAYIPAPFAAHIAHTLGIAHRDTVTIGHTVHAESPGIGRTAVAVQHDDQRSLPADTVGHIEFELAYNPAGGNRIAEQSSVGRGACGRNVRQKDQ